LYELIYISPKIFDVQTLNIKEENGDARRVAADIGVIVYIYGKAAK
jgi:hypothetical protein